MESINKPIPNQLIISIITPSYNSGKYIKRAIESVLNQDYDNWEHIVIDGGSTDNTKEILKSYPHLKWISEPDQGQSDAMNKGFSMSTGGIIGYLNADDEYSTGLFDKIISEFSKFPDVEFMFGDLYQVFSSDIPSRNEPSGSLFAILDYWPCRFPLNAVSYFYKRRVQELIGPFPIDNHFTMDYWFLLRVYKSFSIHYLPINFGYFYFDSTNKSSDAEQAKKSLQKVRNTFLLENPSTALEFIMKKVKSLVGYSLYLLKRSIAKNCKYCK